MKVNRVIFPADAVEVINAINDQKYLKISPVILNTCRPIKFFNSIDFYFILGTLNAIAHFLSRFGLIEKVMFELTTVCIYFF